MTARKIVQIQRKKGDRISFDGSTPAYVSAVRPEPVTAQVISLPPPIPEPSPPVDLPEDPPGPVERQARIDIDALGGKAGLLRAEKTYAETAYALARGIDGTSTGNGATLAAMASAAKELRTTLDRILELIKGRTDQSDPRLSNMGSPD